MVGREAGFELGELVLKGLRRPVLAFNLRRWTGESNGKVLVR